MQRTFGGGLGEGRGHRVAAAVLPVVLTFAGCVSPAGAWEGTAAEFYSAAAAATSCPPGVLLADEQRLVQGGEGGGAFVLDAACPLLYNFDIRGLAGRLEIRLVGPGGVLLQEVAQGVHTDSVRLSTGGSSRGSVQEGALPPGAYRYSFAADRVADFRFVVSVGP